MTRLSAIAALAFAAACSATAKPNRAAPALNPRLEQALETADSLMRTAIGRVAAGAVLIVAKDGVVLKESAYGYAQLYDYAHRWLDAPVPMRRGTVFDLASVTKVMAGTYAIMLLVDDGKVDLDAPVYRYLPDFRGVHLDSIRVRHLLSHSAGLVQWQPLYYAARTREQTYAVIRDMPLQWGVGEGRHYSDLSFMLVGYIAERVTGKPLDAFLEERLYRPLGLNLIGFNPLRRGITDLAATEPGNGYERHMVYDSTFAYKYRGDPRSWDGWRQYVLLGEVNDGNAWHANGGVAGHAGLFATASELRVLLDLLLNRGTYDGRRYLRAETIDRFLTLDRYENFLGWISPKGLPAGSFSHGGFTGTWVLGVPTHGLSIVLLTNRQNLGTNPAGYFPNLAPLQEAVAAVILKAGESVNR